MTDAGLPFSTDAVLESLNDGFQAFDREWRYVYLNRRAEKILGRRREELLGRVCWEEFPEAVGTEFHRHYLLAMETGKPVVFEFFCPHEKTWAEFSLHPYARGLGAFTRDITRRKRAEEALRQSEEQYRALFDQAQSAIVLADETGRYVEASPAACELFGLPRTDLIGRSVADFSPTETQPRTRESWQAFLQTGEQTGEFLLRNADGEERMLEYRARANVRPGLHLSLLRDITDQRRAEKQARLLFDDLQEERDTLDTVNRIGRLLSAELNLDRLVQAATDAATELTSAQFGAFFYNVIEDRGEAYLLYTISGVPREAFSKFPYPRATPLFGPTFRGEGIIRSDDITRDARYGTMPPHFGMPEGHLPVRSYLAVPVLSRSGEVLGGLFFGHAEPGVFTDRAERNLVALVAQIAVAVDNARLYGQALRANEQAQQEIAERTRVEHELRLSEARHKAVLKDVLASVTGGRLRLADTAAELPARLHPVCETIPLSRFTLRTVRGCAREAAQAAGLDTDRENDLVTAASEAAMNAVVHADGGKAMVAADIESGVVQVWIEDHGKGIEMSRLPRATLDIGYTTAGTLGHGFKMVLKTIDALWLLTGPGGTTIVLEQGRQPPKPHWL